MLFKKIIPIYIWRNENYNKDVNIFENKIVTSLYFDMEY